MMIRAIRRLSFGSALIALSGTAVAAAPDSKIEPKTAEAVKAADDAWGEAEANGDYAFVERLLLPGYQSIGSGGKATSREKIVAGARERGRSAERIAQIAEWKAAHPTRPEVTIYGDTAVLTWVSAAPEKAGAVLSSDIFVYRKGHWRAIYSQHSTASQ